MKWLLVVPEYLPDFVGGTIIYTNLVAKNLSEAGHDVHILTTTKDKKLAQKETINQIKIHRILRSYGNMGPLFFNYTNEITNYIVNLDKIENFDCLNVQNAFLVNYKKIRKDLFIISTSHMVITYEYFRKIIDQLKQNFSLNSIKDLFLLPINLPLHYIREIFFLHKANAITVESDFVKNLISKFFPFLKVNKIYKIGIGFDKNFIISDNKKNLREGFNLNDNEVCIFTVRRLDPRMGLINLINASNILIKEYKLNNLKIFIAGKGQLKKTLEQRIKKLNLTKNIFLLGFVSDEDLLKWYKAADLFVMPTKELEGFGIVALQALGLGLPVVSTKAGANIELSGRYYPKLLIKTNNNAKDMANSIKKWLDTKQEYNCDEIAKKVRDDYSWSKIIKKLTKIVNDQESFFNQDKL